MKNLRCSTVFRWLASLCWLVLAGCSERAPVAGDSSGLAKSAAVAAPVLRNQNGFVARPSWIDDGARAPTAQPNAPLGRGEVVSVSFPSPMVAPADFDRPVAVPPVEIFPAVETRFRWRSATEGELSVAGEPAPGVVHRLRLRAGARDLAGAALAAPAWGVVWPESWFIVRPENYGRRGWYDAALPAQPGIDLVFSHPVPAEEVARTVVWRDDRGGTIGSDVRVPDSANPRAGERFEVKPRRALPVGRRIELVVEDTRCALDGSRLAYVHVFPVGETRPLLLETVAGFNQPRTGAFIEARFNQVLDPAGVGPATVRLAPAVPNARVVAEWAALRVYGDFDPAVRYRVEIDSGVRSRLGFALENPAVWHAQFRAKRAAVILPRSIVTTTARRGLALDFTQVNTGALRWRLARVPAESLLAVRRRLDEYRDLDTARRDPVTNEWPLRATELLVESLRLPVAAEGTIDSSGGDREVARTIALPPEELGAGIYLCEISGLAGDGRVAGNRALVLVNREFLVWKTAPGGVLGRLFDVGTGDPVAGAAVRLLAHDGAALGEGTTDAEGQFTLPAHARAALPELALVRRDGALSAHFADLSGGLPSLQRERDDDASERSPIRQWLFSDRGIYRPGDRVRVKGIVREFRDGVLTRPEAGTPVTWQLLRGWREEPVADGATTLSSSGGWEAEIPLPETLPVGQYVVRALGTSCPVKVDEFRAPAFAVEVQPRDDTAGGASRVRVVSRYFHGAPNARAVVRWRALWSPNFPEADETAAAGAPWIGTSDYASPEHELRRPEWARAAGETTEAAAESPSLSAEGTVVLDAEGVAELSAQQPFPPSRRLGAARVRWEVSVVAADGQTVEGEGNGVVPVAPAQPGLALKAGAQPGEVEVTATAMDPDGKLVAGRALRLELFRVEEKSVRENLSRRVVRFRNTPVFTSVLVREVAAPFREAIKVPGTGRFVAVVSLAGVEHSPRASDETMVAGAEPAEFAQWDDSSFDARPERADYAVGETARIALRAPFAGPAWVTVETDRVLHSRFVRLAGNAATIDVPVTAEMHPNARVVVFLFRPETLGAPAERFAECTLRVRRPDTELQVATELAAAKVEPGAAVRGAVSVTAEGRAAGDAEVTLFAVDESVLRYGRWELPDGAAVFFPANAHEMETSSGLRQFGPRRPDDPFFQKGFLLGDGAASRAAVRRNFAALAFWSGALRTDAAGRAEFSFTAPDNLTAYRIVAVAHRGAEQFGHGAKLVEVARRLQVEPALPRFARVGDEVELRALLRQREWPELRGRVECRVEGATLLGAPAQDVRLEKGLPRPVVFRARVGADADAVRVGFTAVAEGADPVRDGVELTLPVKAARVVRRGAVAGVLPAGEWSPGPAVPADWKRGAGAADVVVSATPWLPLLDGLPRLLDYPHGCNEQVSSRVLSFGLMADLLDALPDRDVRLPEYRRRVEAGLAALARARLPSGDMPYWPGQREPNAFVTVQTAWAVVEAQRSGFRVAEPFVGGLRGALTRIARRQDGVRVAPELRAFALVVSASLDPAQKLRADALELFRQRDALGDDGRAFLALALHRWGVMPEETAQLLAELGTAPAQRAFEPATFGSSARTEALRLWARAEIAGAAWTAAERAAAEQAAARLMESSVNFSTQENLWSLLAVRALVKRAAATERASGLVAEGAGVLQSADGTAAGWYGEKLADVSGSGSSVRRIASAGGGSFLLRATYRWPEPEAAEDRGFRVERIVRNLTEAARDGSAAAPFALGDELLVTFRVATERAQAFVALEESLPAAFETVDPEYLRLTLQGKLAGEREGGAVLSHWEKRDDRTLWYFDDVPAGVLSHGVVVRVTSAGHFQWPGAVVAPMYDARFSGTSAARTIEVR